MTEPVPSPLAAGQAALRRGDAAGARRALAALAADAGEPTGVPAGDVAEALARADDLDLDFPAVRVPTLDLEWRSRVGASAQVRGGR